MAMHKVTTWRDDDGFTFPIEPIADTVSITKTPDGFEARYLAQEDDPPDPREWDNLGMMVCFHRRYNLGDKIFKTPEAFEEYRNDPTNKANIVEILPLYLYDHSGLSMSTGDFNDRWDSGQVGWIYTTKYQLDKSGTNPADAKRILQGEVENYDQYLRGDCYILVKVTYHKDKKQADLDTVGGYYGYDDSLAALKTDI